MERYVGTSVRRVEDPRLLSGQGRFIDDVVLPGMLHATFVRSPLPHARIVRIDVEAARVATGVSLVLTGAELDELVTPFQVMYPDPALHRPAHGPLTSDKVRYIGDPVVLVVAASRAAAEDAAELVEIEYEDLPAIATMAQARADGSAPVWDDLGHNVAYNGHSTWGDVDAAFARAAHVVRETFSQSRQTHAPMETRGAVATWDKGRQELMMYAAVQGPRFLAAGLAQHLGLGVHQVSVLNGDIGGSFGQKGYPRSEDVAIAAATRILDVPVKWIEDRVENLSVAGHARDDEMELEAAVSATGEVLGVRLKLTMDQGAYPNTVLPLSILTKLIGMMFPNAYRILNLDFDATLLYSNKATYTAYRAPWEVETWVRERLLDRVARELGIEPIEVRRRNLFLDREFPVDMATGPTLSGITLRAALDQTDLHFDLPAFRIEQAAARAEGRYLGVGLSTFIEAAPGPPNYGTAMGYGMPPERAVARLEIDGTLTVYTGQGPHGQSHETTLAQVAADAMGVPMEKVRVVHGDSRVAPFAVLGTAGSRSATMSHGAVRGATQVIRDKAAAVAAHFFEASPDDIEIVDGMAQVRGTPAVSMPLAQIAMTAWMVPALLPPGMEQGLEATFAFSSGAGGWTQSVHTCLVEVDVHTGEVKILRYLVVEDCGDVINPAVVEGQICGGVAQGIAGVLYEHSAYDDVGNLRASTFMDYLVPTAAEIPEIEIHHVPTIAEQEINTRGVGEGGALGAPAAVSSAVEDALAPFGAKITDQYLPPAKILELVGDPQS